MAKAAPRFKYPLVAVEWHDAQTDDPWQNIDDSSDTPIGARCVSCGFLVRKDKEGGVVLYSTYSTDAKGDKIDQGMQRLEIPGAFISKITKIA